MFDQISKYWGNSSYQFSQLIFFRGLALIYAIAFLSLAPQLLALIGEDGLLPVNQGIATFNAYLGIERFFLLPTLLWINSSDSFLIFLLFSGTLLSVLLFFSIAPRLVTFFLWLIYLSLVVGGQEFLSYQWDFLLLETGFLAIWFAPAQLRPQWPTAVPPSRSYRWLLRWLLFRLIFFSGLSKLLSGDPTWRNLSALQYHYETQPLPTWIAWYLHMLPDWFHSFSTAATLFCELLIPFLLLAPRRWRHRGVFTLIGFQLLIILTGNFGFFNWLTILLCLLNLDDQFWSKWFPQPPQSTK